MADKKNSTGSLEDYNKFSIWLTSNEEFQDWFFTKVKEKVKNLRVSTGCNIYISTEEDRDNEIFLEPEDLCQYVNIDASPKKAQMMSFRLWGEPKATFEMPFTINTNKFIKDYNLIPKKDKAKDNIELD